MKPSNLLIIMSDEHNPKVMGCAGHPVVKTPSIDALAARGTMFSSAYTTCPVCVPARAAFAAGKYVHQIGFWDNADAYDGSVPSWHHRLRERGHCVVSIGKLHFRGHAGDDNGFSEEIIPMNIVEGKGDLIAGRFSATPQRRRVIAFTQEVFPTRTVVVTRKPHAGVRTLEELKAERVGTIAGTSMYEALLAAGIPPGRIDTSLDSGELSEALRGGKISAAAWWLEGAIQAQRRDSDLSLGLVLGPPESLAYGVRKEDQALLAALNDHLQVVRSSGTWNRLTIKYFGDGAPVILRKAREE